MKVLVTGGSGFIGTSLLEELSNDSTYELGSFDIVTPKERFPKVKYFFGDVRDVWASLPDTFREFSPDAIVHLCALARVDPSLTDPFSTYDVNVVGTLNILKFAASQRLPPHIILASSEAIYGQAECYPTRETDNFRPISPYASSKIAADVLCQQLNGRLGMKTCVLRSGMGMGPRSNPAEQVISRFISNALRGRALRFPSGSVTHPTRDINPVWNFVGAVKLVLESHASGVYNVGSGREISILEAAEKIVQAVGTGEILFDDDFHYRQGEEGMRVWLDITKARTELGYEPKVSFEEALPPTIDWLAKNMDTYWAKP